MGGALTEEVISDKAMEILRNVGIPIPQGRVLQMLITAIQDIAKPVAVGDPIYFTDKGTENLLKQQVEGVILDKKDKISDSLLYPEQKKVLLDNIREDVYQAIWKYRYSQDNVNKCFYPDIKFNFDIQALNNGHWEVIIKPTEPLIQIKEK